MHSETKPTFRNEAARDAAWGRRYARYGAKRALIRARYYAPEPLNESQRLDIYRDRLRQVGYDSRDFARRVARGAAIQDALKPASVLKSLLPDRDQVIIRSTRDNGPTQSPLFTDADVERAR